ncbi:NADH:flavin oxidoreductase/NADH oxidase [Mycena olivaceomarginata]|nr:NADH:flavin oxidoreductase/NADH oxidase [Mycena olivaceomarginata]
MAKLFTPIQVGDIQLRHRVVQAPMTRLRVDAGTNVILPTVKEYYGQRASTPGTLIISEGTVVAKKAGAYAPPAVASYDPKKSLGGVHAASPGIWSEAQIAAWREVTDALADPKVNFDLVSASAIPLPGETIIPRALTVEDIQEYIQMFVRAGFDGVEIHGANGYLLDCRTDAYGGSPENRSRLLLEISKVGVRISPWSSFQGMLMADPIPTFTHLVRLHHRSTPARTTRATPNDFIRALWGARTLISAGGYTRASALERAEQGDIIAFGRPFLANPDLPVRLEKDIPLTKGDRGHGYTSYPFAE